MSGKYAKKKKSGTRWKLLLLLVMLLCLAAALWFAKQINDREQMPLTENSESASVPADTAEDATELPYTFREEMEGITGFSLDQGLEITRYGKYIGAYMEDGSDEFVTNVMMIEVCNTGDQPVQYAKITLTGSAGDAVFAMSTLMPGERVVVLEAERKPYDDADVYTEAQLDNVAFFAEFPSLLEEQLLIQPLDGGFNITNISAEDINGEVAVYFKDVAGDVYYGGITYVCRIEGGLKAGEVKQIMSANFTDSGSRVVFIQIGQ